MISKLRPWRHVVTPREDLRDGKPLDAAEFAVHLDQVRDGKAPAVYIKPDQFFARTFLTKNMLELAGQVVRRLNGVTTETSAIFNLATQFGGGKTHSLTLLYHLVKHGPASHGWVGVGQILNKSGQSQVPTGEAAVFVGTEFDSLTGRGGADDGTPLRRTPWGELAWQLGGERAFALVSKHDADGIAPGGDVLAKVIPDSPCLILMDELMNYISRNRKSGLSTQFYNFVHNLTECVRGKTRAVLAVSIPASEMEMTAEDLEDYNRITKLLDRTGKALVMSADAETSEIIRRRLFEWNLEAVSVEGKVLLDKDAKKTCEEYAQWCIDNKTLIPGWFSVDEARKAFEACYPFHPTVLSVFERKWRGIGKFQQTRGVLRLLALWVARSFREGNEGNQRDALIGLGSAPLEDSTFRSACFEQLGERNLETAVTTDIAGSANAHAVRLDNESTEEIRKARLHRKVATVIFFESNGGQLKGRDATLPEVRLCVGELGLDIGNVDTTLDALITACYYLTVERNTYRFSLRENLNKRFADRKATVQAPVVQEHLKREIQTLTSKTGYKVGVVHFPEKSIQIADRPALTVVVADLGQTMETEKATLGYIESLVRESGSSARTYKSGQIWIVADSTRQMREEATKFLAWKDIQAEADSLKYDESQLEQLRESVKRAERDLREAIWRAFKFIVLLGKDNKLKVVDLGLVTSSVGASMVDNVINRLQQDGDIEKGVAAGFLLRNWPPALPEWSTRNVRDAFFASPQFPRLLFPDAIKDTIARGVSNGQIAYAGKHGDGHFEPFVFEQALNAADVEISEDVFILTREAAVNYRDAVKAAAGGEKPASPSTPPQGSSPAGGTTPMPVAAVPGGTSAPVPGDDEVTGGGQTDFFRRMTWTGEVPPKLWMNFYTKVLSKHATDSGLKLKVTIETSPSSGISKEKIEETRSALKELGLAGGELRGE
jgi:hypothetical protein